MYPGGTVIFFYLIEHARRALIIPAPNGITWIVIIVCKWQVGYENEEDKEETLGDMIRLILIQDVSHLEHKGHTDNAPVHKYTTPPRMRRLSDSTAKGTALLV